MARFYCLDFPSHSPGSAVHRMALGTDHQTGKSDVSPRFRLPCDTR